jgi:phenylpropionate dioxygenase-like ring-hydroxylating dioxygenase large terminal subunit
MQRVASEDHDRGTAYGRAPGVPDYYLTQVGPGTPGGEFWRRYWNPVALSEDATTTPTQIRILGEDLILFRNGRGEPGLLYPRCVHRGTSLIYGKCEDDGIRCCYHGWKFAPDGTCLDQPCEPPRVSYPQSVRQPWYPVQEQYGVIWAYMGPPEKKPLLQKYDVFEELGPDDYIVSNDMGRSTGGIGKRFIAPCNWLQHWENAIDPAHVQILHVQFSGFQFTENVAAKRDPWVFEPIEDGVLQWANGYMPDGRRIERNFEARFPGEKRAADPWMRPGPMSVIGFTVPVDDTHYLVIAVTRQTRGQEGFAQLKMQGKSWDELTPAERRDLPSDYEAQVGQGPVTLHSEERLATPDKGIVLLRRALRKQIEIVAAGGDPAGVVFDPARQVKRVEGGNVFGPLPAELVTS